MQIGDNRTAIALTNQGNKAGIAAREKVASDGRTQLSIYGDGQFHVYISGAVTAGQMLMAAPDIATYPNHLAICNSGAITASGGQVFARAMEAHAFDTLSTALVELVPASS